MTSMELGGNITLTGFSERDFTELIVIKKIVGQYARKLSDSVSNFGKLSLMLKQVHNTPEGHGKFEIISKADVNGHEFASEVTGHNLFVVLDESLKHLSQQIHKAHEKEVRH
jgi:hypothetical protein